MTVFACSACGRADLLQGGFDRVQCLACGAFTDYQGNQTVPTSATEAGAVYTGPGFELILDPNVPAVSQSTDTSVQIGNPVPPAPPVTSSPETGNPTPGGENNEGVAPHPVQPADTEVFPAPQLTGDQSSPAPAEVPAPEPTPTPAPVEQPQPASPVEAPAPVSEPAAPPPEPTPPTV